jgi:hypothetical protein
MMSVGIRITIHEYKLVKTKYSDLMLVFTSHCFLNESTSNMNRDQRLTINEIIKIIITASHADRFDFRLLPNGL